MSIDADLLRRLTASRWLIPILARMHREPGSRFGALVRQLGISRSMLATSLDTLEREGWIVRNPGHGHPLRPEYLLTATGREAAVWSAALDRALTDAGIAIPSLNRWAIPLLKAFGSKEKRFGDLAEALSPISPRALSMALDHLASLSLIEKRSESRRHPRYRLRARGRAVAKAIRG